MLQKDTTYHYSTTVGHPYTHYKPEHPSCYYNTSLWYNYTGINKSKKHKASQGPPPYPCFE